MSDYDQFDIENLAVDLSETVLPDEGEYKVRFDEIKGGRFEPSDKNPQGLANITFTLTIYGAEDPKANGRKIFQRSPREGAGAYLVKQIIKVAELADPEVVVPQAVNFKSLLNRAALVAIKHDQDKEKKYEKRLQVSRFIEMLD